MCAIYGFLNYGRKVKNRVLKNIIRELSIAAECRGTDATGISYVNNGEIVTFKQPKPAHKMKLFFPKDTVAVIGHNRLTTQGSEKKNCNNHPFEGKTSQHSFALAHNGVLYNDKEIKREKKLPQTQIETDSYVAAQLVEQAENVDMDAVKNMAEIVDGSFVFTILRDDNTLFLVKGSNPITLYHFPEQELYIYASTKEILKTALKNARFKEPYEEIKIDTGDILQINSDGEIFCDTFETISHYHFDWHDWYGLYSCEESEDDLLAICNCFGVDKEDVEFLYSCGYTPDEIEEMLFDTVHNGGCCPLGYKLNDERKLEIEPHEAEAVRIIYQMYADGHGYSDIINYLNDNGYRTKKGNIFGKNSLHDILINLKYTGTFVYNRSSGLFCNKRNNHKNKSDNEIIRVPGGCPQIVSKELFEKVQARMSQNRRTGGRFHSKEFYLLTGKIFCEICGKRMQGNLRYAGRNKSRLATYRCNTHRSECKNKEINKDYLDVYIVDLLRQKIFNAKSLRRIVQNLNGYIKTYNSDYDKHYESVKAEYDAVCENLNNLTDAIEKGIVTESIISRAEKLEEQKNEIQNRLVNMHQFTPLEYKDFSPLIDEFKGLKRNTEEFRTFVQRYVNRITAFPYHLEIELNTGLGMADELNDVVTIRRGELYEMFESRVKE